MKYHLCNTTGVSLVESILRAAEASGDMVRSREPSKMVLGFEACSTGIQKVVRYMPCGGKFTCGKCRKEHVPQGTYASTAHVVLEAAAGWVQPERAVFDGILCMPCAREVYREANVGTKRIAVHPRSQWIEVCKDGDRPVYSYDEVGMSIVEAAQDLRGENIDTFAIEQALRMMHKHQFYARRWLWIVRRKKRNVSIAAECADKLGFHLDANVRDMIYRHM